MNNLDKNGHEHITDTMKITGLHTHLETAKVEGITISLLASGDGTQLMRCQLHAGSRWTLLPEVAAQEFQCCYLTKGKLAWKSKTKSGVLKRNESLSLHPVSEIIELTALKETEFLFVCSRPVFDRYMNGLQDIEQLAVSIEQKDGYTADHCNRIKSMSMKMADLMDLSPDIKFDIKIGSFLHDVGKVKIPDSILNKPGALTLDEWKLMKQHPMYGRDMLQNLHMDCLAGASVVILQHHERYNGSGYPYGLKGDQIHIGAAIVAVVDSFDAMTSDRIYRKAKPVERALAELKDCKGTLYHPDIVDMFLKLI